MPVNNSGTLPLKVGLIIEDQNPSIGILGGSGPDSMSKHLLANSGANFGPRFATALRRSKLFEDVKYPLRLSRDALESVDLTISAQFGYKFTQDPAQAPKIILVCFTGFITGALLTETSHHAAQAVLSIADRAGKDIKTYDETVDVVAESMVSMFAEMKTTKAGPPAALDNLIAKLVQNLIDDRNVFQRLGARPRPSAQPAPSEGATQTPQAAASAAPLPAPAFQPDAEPQVQTPPKPAAPKKPTDFYDSQLLP